MQIRRAIAGEHRRLAEIHVLARYDMAYLPRVHSFSSTENWMRKVVVPSNGVWVAEIDGAAVAYAWLHEGFLHGLYVHPSYQRQGVGGRLLSVVCESAAGGFHLWVFEANEGAIRFYARHGARLVRKTDGSGNEEQLPDRLMSFG
jgi:GNAT superfamily N-acetyltransferase